jgi:hypothetical protein
MPTRHRVVTQAEVISDRLASSLFWPNPEWPRYTWTYCQLSVVLTALSLSSFDFRACRYASCYRYLSTDGLDGVPTSRISVFLHRVCPRRLMPATDCGRRESLVFPIGYSNFPRMSLLSLLAILHTCKWLKDLRLAIIAECGRNSAGSVLVCPASTP